MNRVDWVPVIQAQDLISSLELGHIPLKFPVKQRRISIKTYIKRRRLLATIAFLITIGAFLLVARPWQNQNPSQSVLNKQDVTNINTINAASPVIETNGGFPQLSPLPATKEIWECEVAIVGGSFGGIAAAGQAMQAGVQTCVIELTPWLGGQISSQAVSAIDKSQAMNSLGNFSANWIEFKKLIAQQTVNLPAWTKVPVGAKVADINGCWVGSLCFPPDIGAKAAELWLKQASAKSPKSRWGTGIAFKGAKFDPDGKNITAIYAVKRTPKDPNYFPKGRLSQELVPWYYWSSDDLWAKTPLKLQAPAGKRMIVIDATDTAELIAWAGLPYRVGSEAKARTKEVHAAPQDNPECTQAFTYPFALAIYDDKGKSRAEIAKIQPGWSRETHRSMYDLEGFPMFRGRSVFNYRRIVNATGSDRFKGTPGLGDITMINWNRGNDWGIMNPSLIMTEAGLQKSGQRQNWTGGLNYNALKDGENHALLFAEWLMEKQSRPNFPLSLLQGKDSPMGTESGLSIYPYIREGRRILGRSAYNQTEFQILEQDIRSDMSGGRDFRKTAVALTHYDVDIHGCRYMNWEPSNSAENAPSQEENVFPVFIPLEALIPQKVENLLMGGKGLAVSHIVNAVTRIHNGEWGVGTAAGTVAAWLLREAPADMIPAEVIPKGLMPQLQTYLRQQGVRLDW